MPDIKIYKVALVDMIPEKLKTMSDDEIRLSWLRLNQWYGDAMANGRAVEDYVNAARWVMTEFERREFSVDQELPLSRAASKLGKELVEARFDNLPNEMVVVNDFVSVVGSTVKGVENPNDLDVLIRAECDYESNLLVKAENAWLQVRKVLNPNKQLDLQFIYNAQGSHDDYIPVYDLVLRKRCKPETKIVKACSPVKIEDFIRDQSFELAGDNISDKGPAIGVVLDAFDGKVMVEFDEPQTFDLEELQPYIEKTDKGWFIHTNKINKDITISDVHVPTTYKPRKEGAVRLDLGCGKQKKEGFFGIDLNQDAEPDMVYDLSFGIPFGDNSVDEINAQHFLEHCPDKTKIMSEIYRALKPGGKFTFEVPSTRGEGAFAHPDHKTFWNKSDFSFWTQDELVEDRPKFDMVEIDEVGEGDRINVCGTLRKPGGGIYIRRNLTNAQELYDWAQAAGLSNLIPAEEMHVTQVYSKSNFDVEPLKNNIACSGGSRSIEKLGDKGAVVLHFCDSRLSNRWDDTMASGASWEYDSGYKPHITLSYDAGDCNLEDITPPDMMLRFGPEIYESLNESWAEDKGFRVSKAIAPFTPFQPPKPKLAGMTEIFNTKNLWDWAESRLPVAVEPKWNGFRVIAERKGAEMRLWTEGKRGTNLISKLPSEFVSALKSISGDWVLDCDLAIEKNGKRLSRPELMKLNRDKIEFSAGEKPVLTIFDMPYHNGDRSEMTYTERKKHLDSLGVNKAFIKISPARIVRAKDELDPAVKWGFKFDKSEGVVVKSVESSYPKGATSDWSKLKRVVELKVKVLDVKPVKGGDHIYLGGLTLSQGDTWKNVTDGNVELGWTFNSKLNAKKGDIITVSVLELVPDEEDNKLTWLGATVLDIDDARSTPYSSGQAIDIAERGSVLQKDEAGFNNQCFFCEAQANKVILWGGGNKTLYTCNSHLSNAIEHVININRDAVNDVIDISQPGAISPTRESESEINININLLKELGGEGDINRETVATKFWDDNWDTLFPKSGKGRFVYQHHWRGLAEDEVNLTDAALLNTSHSLHGDLRFEAGDGLWGFSAFIGTARDNKNAGGDKLISAKPDTNIRGTFKLKQPKEWLDVGVKKPYISEPGGVGATSQSYAVFQALDYGTYEVGVRHRHFVEVFLHGKHLNGRYVISSVPLGGNERAWMIKKPKDQTPFAESNDLEKESITLKKRGHKKLVWAKPGEAPKVIDLMKIEKAGDLYVKFAKAFDEEKHLVTGIVLEPDTVDAHNDTISADHIEKAAHEYMRKSRLVGLQHRKKAQKVDVVESYIAPTDFTLGGQQVKKGTWLMTVKVLDNKTWEAVKRGDYTGFSIGGYGQRTRVA